MAHDDIKSIVGKINDAWLNSRFDELHEYFDENVVLAHPGFEKRTAGRTALIDSYAEFARAATIHHFNAQEPTVDISGDAAITTTPWEMRYTYAGQTLEERGWDMLVFRKTSGAWRVVWRTVMLNTMAAE
ncbi:MAG TPA: nuclear transport factor 2 family protein [Vicinamibacterales bacterium]|nr:nuclear transport factor 2 family protein [Vicinamibacterales bacterium]